MNPVGILALYRFEMARGFRTILQTIIAPVLSTSLYFVVFGAAIGTRMSQIDGVSYGAFIVPGLIMLSLMTESISNASFGIYMPRFNGTIYEVLSAPLSAIEIVIGYVGAAATKSMIVGLIILGTARLFVPLPIVHPAVMVLLLLLMSVTFCAFGFVVGVWSDSFEHLSFVPLLVITPLTFLGGTFYSVAMLPGIWKTVTMINPVVYLISLFRWSFYGLADVDVGLSLSLTLGFLALCLAVIWWIFRTGYRLKA